MTSLWKGSGYVRTQPPVLSKGQSQGYTQVWQPCQGAPAVTTPSPPQISPHFFVKVPRVKTALLYPLFLTFSTHTHMQKRNVLQNIFCDAQHTKLEKYRNMKNKNHPLSYHLQMFAETFTQLFLFFLLVSNC